jgi:hypothetical protein
MSLKRFDFRFLELLDYQIVGLKIIIVAKRFPEIKMLHLLLLQLCSKKKDSEKIATTSL